MQRGRPASAKKETHRKRQRGHCVLGGQVQRAQERLLKKQHGVCRHRRAKPVLRDQRAAGALQNICVREIFRVNREHGVAEILCRGQGNEPSGVQKSSVPLDIVSVQYRLEFWRPESKVGALQGKRN